MPLTEFVFGPYLANGGAGGIRTLDTLLAYTHFPGERLRPLGHRSACHRSVCARHKPDPATYPIALERGP